ncbi:MAG: hydrogenase expression/formation protein [Burkholderiales bacterium]
MKDFPLPVRALGPASQPPEDVPLEFLAMPREMHTFAMPRVPERVDPAALRAARDVLAAFAAALAAWDPGARADAPVLDLAGVPAPALAIVDQVLGEGEVSVRIDGESRCRIQESVFTGLWRVCTLDDAGLLVGDRLEAGALPRIVVDAARAGTAAAPPLVNVLPGAMNSPALLAEIGSQLAARAPGMPAHVINLTLFPLTPDDHAMLAQALPVGPVAMISRGFGNCHVSSTALADVWRVQYFNSMQTLILNTIEIVDVPAAALAAPEDLADSRERLAELVDWMSADLADAS